MLSSAAMRSRSRTDRTLARRPLRVAIALSASALLVSVACSSGGVLENPLVRVRLTDQLPPKERRTALSATVLDCKRTVALPAGGVAPRFLITWRVLDFGTSRYVGALQVAPEGSGRLEGVRAPKATASVGQLKNVGDSARVIASVSVRVQWSADKGCGKVSASKAVELRADDKSCTRPKTPKLLRPVQ